jgi:hypothetical protein
MTHYFKELKEEEIAAIMALLFPYKKELSVLDLLNLSFSSSSSLMMMMMELNKHHQREESIESLSTGYAYLLSPTSSSARHIPLSLLQVLLQFFLLDMVALGDIGILGSCAFAICWYLFGRFRIYCVCGCRQTIFLLHRI